MADNTLRDTFAKRLDPYLAIGTTPKDIAPILDALIAAVRAESTATDHAAFTYALRCNVDGTTGEVTCPDGDIRPHADAAYGHYLLTRVPR